jgi:VWFA-related protein
MKSRLWLFSLSLFASLFVVIDASLIAQDTVRVNVSALGQGAGPVTNLTKNDFAVKDSGKARTVTAFAAPSANKAAEKLEAGEYGNFSNLREADGAVFLVLDTIHTRYIDERDARLQILKFLGTAAQAKRAVTLAILTDKGLRVYHDYRTGSATLLAALSKAGLAGIKGIATPPGVNESEVAAEAARLTTFSKGENSNPTPENNNMQMSVDAPMYMFQEVAMAGYGLPGRKILAWITNEVPFDIDPKTKQFKSPVESSHGVAVNGQAVGGTKESLNSADVKKIMPIWRRTVRTLFDGGFAVYPVEVRGSSSAGTSSLTLETMRTLAQVTGGKALYGSNDPFPEVFTASTATSAGYTLTYASDASTGTDFHQVEVSVNQPNVQVGQSAGYFPYEGTPKSRAGEEVGMAMRSPLEFTGILFEIAVSGLEEGASGKKKVNLVITLPGDSGIVNETTGSVDVGLVAEALNSGGQKVGTMNEGAGGKFQPDQVAQIKEMGFQLKRSFDVAPGDCTVHFVIRDNQTGRTGDVIFPLAVK